MSLPTLNLLNFELPSANKCKYVLTSPRSLKACRKAGIKPIELLYKCASEFEKETIRKEDVQNLFQSYEKERQRKLALCRLIRNQFLLYGYSLVKDNWCKHERIKRYSPKLQDAKDRALPTIRECYIRKRAETPENMRNVKVQFRGQTEKSSLILPKVNFTFANNNENKPSEVSNESTERNDEAKIESQSTIRLSPIVINRSENEMNKSFEIMDETNMTSKFKRPNSSFKRKTKEYKRRTKVPEQHKLLQNLKVQYSDPNYCIQKFKHVIENSVERDLKEIEAQIIQRELAEGMEKWQDKVLLLQWLDVNRAREQASRELEIKVEKLQQKSRAKTIIHTMNINKVKEAEDIKAEGLRRQVEEKERKINILQQEKGKIILESKSRALSIQDLKDHIRSIMTPETFDQKVAKLGMYKQVLNSHMCARVMQRSHIWLG